MDTAQEGEGGTDSPPAGQAAPLEMPRALVHGLAEATTNVALGTTISKGGRAQGAPVPPRRPPSSRRSAKVCKFGKPSQFRTTPYPKRSSCTPPTAAASAPTEEGSSKVQTVEYTGPYIPWSPTLEQLQECSQLLKGEGSFSVDQYVHCLPLKDDRRVGNKKWACSWERCDRVLGSQGEARAHALCHLDRGTSPICRCSKNTFSNAKTLGSHLRKFHNVSLKALCQDPPVPLLENPEHPIKE